MENKQDPRDEWLENSGNWLKADKVTELEKQGMVLATILTEPKLVDKSYQDGKDEKRYQRFEMEVDIRGEVYLFDMSKRVGRRQNAQRQ